MESEDGATSPGAEEEKPQTETERTEEEEEEEEEEDGGTEDSDGAPEESTATASVVERSQEGPEGHGSGSEDADAEARGGRSLDAEESAGVEAGGDEPLASDRALQQQQQQQQPPPPGAPAAVEAEAAVPPEEDDDDDEELRASALRQLRDERERLTQLNGQLQARLAELLRRRTGEEARAEPQERASEPEQRYRACAAAIEELRARHERDAAARERQAERLRLQARQRLERVESEWRALQALERDVATEALARRVGRQAAQAQVRHMQEAEQRREHELARARLENVRLRREVRRFEAALRGKEEQLGGGGLHFMDLEQLKMENETYAEKVEERGEELLRLRRRITSTVQVLTHVREKLHFVAEESEARRAQLAHAEAALGRARDALARTKRARDGLRARNQRLRRRCGMLGNVTLLRDWEDKVSATEELERRLDALKRRHGELAAQCRGLESKVRQAGGREESGGP